MLEMTIQMEVLSTLDSDLHWVMDKSQNNGCNGQTGMILDNKRLAYNTVAVAPLFANTERNSEQCWKYD